jgi:predicted nucleic acid-binding protein
MIVLDASVLIAYLDGDDDHHEASEAILAAAIDEDVGANSLTLAEVLVVPVRECNLSRVQSA